MTRHRYIAVTAGAGLMAMISAIFLIGAPIIPTALGVAIATVVLIWRAPVE